jgi:hypothetical protein
MLNDATSDTATLAPTGQFYLVGAIVTLAWTARLIARTQRQHAAARRATAR